MGRLPYFMYGVLFYLVFFLTFLCAIGFVGNLLVPKAIDSVPLGSIAAALLVDTTLRGIFAVQHKVMARPAFKDWWTRWIPRPIERSTYVSLSSLALILLFWQWRPLGGATGTVDNEPGCGALPALFALGW